MNISSTTKHLIVYSKQTDDEFNFINVKKSLIDLYHPDMRLADVMHILFKSIQEVMNEDRFKLNHGDRFINEVIQAPLKVSFFDVRKLYDLEYVYDKMIAEIMYGFRYTTVDWYREELGLNN